MRVLTFLCVLFFSVNSLLSQSNSPCQGGSYDLIKPFLGTWKEYRMTDSTEVYTGTLTVKLDVKGCALSQRYVEKDSSFVYQTLGYVDASSGIWNETYIFSTGSNSVYQWIVHEGDITQRKVGGSSKTDNIYQLKFVDRTESQYIAVGQRSHDGGKTWKSEGRTRIERVSK